MTLTFGGDGDKWGGTKRDDATAAVVSERSLAIQRAVRVLQRTFLPPVVPPTSVFPTHSIKVHWNPGVSEQGTPVIVWDSSTSLLLHGTLESINTRSVKASDGHVHVIDVALVRLPHGFLRAFPACHVFLSGLMHNGRFSPRRKFATTASHTLVAMTTPTRKRCNSLLLIEEPPSVKRARFHNTSLTDFLIPTTISETHVLHTRVRFQATCLPGFLTLRTISGTVEC